jgi:hypothetical protein
MVAIGSYPSLVLDSLDLSASYGPAGMGQRIRREYARYYK